MKFNKTGIHCISLGCPKNLADTEHVLAMLEESSRGLEIVTTPEEASIILVNTCAFIEDAVSESIENILEVAEDKKTGQSLCVIGCLPLRYGKQLMELLPEVDFFSFENGPYRIAQELSNFLFGTRVESEALERHHRRMVISKPWSAYVKISDGCQNRCTYCMIPRIKGGLVCKKPDLIVQEIEYLVSKGAKEIVLVAQDLTAYKYGELRLVDLIELILSRTEVEWLRLMYLYPQGINQELLKLIATENRLCNYLDIPIQHASNKILARMGRNTNAKELDKIFELIYDTIPNCSVRTTVMVGFPGEDEEDFEQLLSFIKRWRFHHLGCFSYSDEEEVPSHRFRDKVPDRIARGRKDMLMSVQREISYSINQSFIGQVIPVLVDGYCEETELLLCGRGMFQAPDIDGGIYLNRGLAKQGQVCKVQITEAHEYDLIGHVAEADENENID